MSDVKWTKEQLQAIEEKGSNILVAAAAGSGKTAVLVERIIHKIIDENIDIDKLLVVTFTNAAASEMRQRVLEAIYKKLEQEPANINLQKQINLLNKASICTIHSFCLDVIHNHFYELDLSSNFKIADETEIELLKQEVLDDLFEQKYLEEDKEFVELLETYTNYRGDEPLQNLILSVYKFIQSSPFPEKWLHEKVELLNLNCGESFETTLWGQAILNEIKEELEDCILKLEKVKHDIEPWTELTKFYNVICEDIMQIKEVLKNVTSWDKTYEAICNINFSKWPVDKKVTLDLKDEAKEIRDKVKKTIKEKVGSLINATSSQIQRDIEEVYPKLQKLEKLILEFSNNFAEKKKEKNLIDFNDIEHFALKILTDENGNKTEIAKKYEEKFEEIAIDEYQDSNLVQETILNSISRGNNIFMVGDVKQSIYKFRGAKPELFLQKYDSYKNKEQIEKSEEIQENENKNDNLKIQLFRNFRSRNNILDITNLVFEAIMSKNLGDIDYNENEYLNYGANYQEPEQENAIYAGTAELNIIDMKEDDTNSDDEELERVEDDVLEARFVAKQINDILQSDYQVFDKKEGYRKVQPRDIVVLLRSISSLAPIYEKEISDLDLPVFSDNSISYLDSVEIETILSLLKIIDNPMQDIPLVIVLRSIIGNFTDNELISIRLTDKNCNFYNALMKARISCENDLKDKIERLLSRLDSWRKQSEYLPLNELIWQIYLDTGYYHYVGLLPNGAMRQANLKTLFEKAKQYESASFKGLFHFVQFIERLKKQNGDLSSAKLIGENANVIRIMSIHKSKGLEFPIVFLSGTQKKFNLKDLNDAILLHQDLGFGPTLIDTNKKIKYATKAKQAISLKAKQEILSEEERILYVALTRAKEKLIITGRSKNLENSLQDKEKNLSIYYNKDSYKIDSKLIKKCNSYLDLLEYVYLFNKNKEISLKGRKLKIEDIIKLKSYKKQDLIKQLKNDDTQEKRNIELEINEKVKELSTNYEELKDNLEWKYLYEVDTKLPTKTSVSKLKQEELNKLPSLKSEENWEVEETLERYEIKIVEDNNVNEIQQNMVEPQKNQSQKRNLADLVPNFINKTSNEITPAKKGSLVHLCIQKLDESKDYKLEDIKNLIQSLVENEIITEIEAEAIDSNLIYTYTQSSLFKELSEAKEIHKEQPFYINIPAKEIFEEAKQASSEKMILVQGIIDLYYIDSKNQIHLVDFKTDYVPKGKEKEVAEKYTIQIDIYKKALEQALGKKVTTAQICLANSNWECVSLGTLV